MDYSNLYCDMCKNCQELSGLKETVSIGERILMKKDSKNKYVLTEKDNGIFLPTDKQLHALVDFKYDVNDPYFVFIKSSYHKYEIKTPFNIFRSFEQYALAYVMKTLYGKVWFNNEWIPENEIELDK